MRDRTKTPAVSVIVPFLDEERYLGSALASVFAQTLRGWELLLVDDGSADRSASIARAWARRAPGRARVLEHPGGARRGVFASRMLAASRARARALALLDADDVWEPRYLERHLAFWEGASARGAGMTYGPCRFWFPDEPAKDAVQTLPSKAPRVFPRGEVLASFLSSGYGTTPCPSAAFFSRELFLALARLEPAARRLSVYEDQLLYWGCAARRPVAVHQEALVRYRRGTGPKSFAKASGEALLREEARLLEAVLADVSPLLAGRPILGRGGLGGRLAALRSRSCGEAPPFFYERIPAALKRLAARS